MRRYAGLAVFIFCALLGAQQVGDESGGKAAIAGKVVDAVSGEPLKKAIVIAHAMESREMPSMAYTDAEGKFALPNLDAGRYGLAAERNGYARVQHGQRDPNRPGAPLTLKAGQRMTDVLFRLVPAAVITGRILDEDNEPVAHAQVSAVQFRYFQGQRQPVPGGTASTNDRGEYRIFGLPAGRHYVSVTIQGGFNRYSGFRVVSDSAEGYIATYYPGVLDVSQAVAIETAAGQEMPGIDIKIVPNRVLRVSGIVVEEETGRPARNVAVMPIPRNAPYSGLVARQNPNGFVRDDSGAFELKGLTPGEYWLVARSGDRETPRSGRTALDLAGRDVSGIRLVLSSGTSLGGTIRFEGDGELDMTNMRVLLRPVIQALFMGGGWSNIKPDGSFEIKGLAQEEYDIEVMAMGAPAEFYLKSAVIDDTDVLEHGLAIGAAGVAGELHLVLSGNGGRISGTVRNAKSEPQPGAQVVLLPPVGARRQAILTKFTAADQYGGFEFRAITPGSYTLYAWDEVEQGAWTDPDFIAAYKDDGDGIKVEEGSTLQKDLSIIVTGSR